MFVFRTIRLFSRESFKPKKILLLVSNTITTLSKLAWKFKLNFFIMLKSKWSEYSFLARIALLLSFTNNTFKMPITKAKAFVGKKYLNRIGSFLILVSFKFLMAWMFWKRVLKYALAPSIVDIFLAGIYRNVLNCKIYRNQRKEVSFFSARARVLTHRVESSVLLLEVQEIQK